MSETKHMLFTDEGVIGVTAEVTERHPEDVTLRFRVPITTLRLPREVLEHWYTMLPEDPDLTASIDGLIAMVQDANNNGIVSLDEAERLLAPIGVYFGEGDATRVVFSRHECVWHYCPNPEHCIQSCSHPRS
jgi:hypothetical protein